jgi:hypothetical protein
MQSEQPRSAVRRIFADAEARGHPSTVTLFFISGSKNGSKVKSTSRSYDVDTRSGEKPKLSQKKTRRSVEQGVKQQPSTTPDDLLADITRLTEIWDDRAELMPRGCQSDLSIQQCVMAANPELIQVENLVSRGFSRFIVKREFLRFIPTGYHVLQYPQVRRGYCRGGDVDRRICPL